MIELRKEQKREKRSTVICSMISAVRDKIMQDKIRQNRIEQNKIRQNRIEQNRIEQDKESEEKSNKIWYDNVGQKFIGLTQFQC